MPAAQSSRVPENTVKKTFKTFSSTNSFFQESDIIEMPRILLSNDTHGPFCPVSCRQVVASPAKLPCPAAECHFFLVHPVQFPAAKPLQAQSSCLAQLQDARSFCQMIQLPTLFSSNSPTKTCLAFLGVSTSL